MQVYISLHFLTNVLEFFFYLTFCLYEFCIFSVCWEIDFVITDLINFVRSFFLKVPSALYFSSFFIKSICKSRYKSYASKKIFKSISLINCRIVTKWMIILGRKLYKWTIIQNGRLYVAFCLEAFWRKFNKYDIDSSIFQILALLLHC